MSLRLCLQWLCLLPGALLVACTVAEQHLVQDAVKLGTGAAYRAPVQVVDLELKQVRSLFSPNLWLEGRATVVGENCDHLLLTAHQLFDAITEGAKGDLASEIALGNTQLARQVALRAATGSRLSLRPVVEGVPASAMPSIEATVRRVLLPRPPQGAASSRTTPDLALLQLGAPVTTASCAPLLGGMVPASAGSLSAHMLLETSGTRSTSTWRSGFLPQRSLDSPSTFELTGMPAFTSVFNSRSLHGTPLTASGVGFERVVGVLAATRLFGATRVFTDLTGSNELSRRNLSWLAQRLEASSAEVWAPRITSVACRFGGGPWEVLSRASGHMPALEPSVIISLIHDREARAGWVPYGSALRLNFAAYGRRVSLLRSAHELAVRASEEADEGVPQREESKWVLDVASKLDDVDPEDADVRLPPVAVDDVELATVPVKEADSWRMQVRLSLRLKLNGKARVMWTTRTLVPGELGHALRCVPTTPLLSSGSP